jgi:uncharacterized protein involved in outer membrane biogenesis
VKKLLTGLGALVALLLLVALIAPSFVDWSRYKGEIAAKVKELTGRQFAIDGGISLAILPTPRLTVQGVRLANLPGAMSPDMALLKALDVRVAFAPLLAGRIQVESLDLVEPQVVLERLPDGRVNWRFTPERPRGAVAEAAPAAPAGLPGWFQLDHVTIHNAAVVYRDDATGQVETVGQIEGGLSAVTPLGPFRVQGHAVARGVPVSFEATLERVGGTGPAAVGLKLGLTGAELGFTGDVAPTDGGAELAGKLRLSGVDLRSATAAVGAVDVATLPAFLAQSFGLEGTLTASAAKMALNGLTLRLGDSDASGALIFEPGTPNRASLTLALARVDLDKWLAMKAAGPAGGGVARGDAVAGKPAAGAAAPAAAGAGFGLPRDLDATADAKLEALIYRGGVVRQVHLGATLHQGELVLQQLTAALPGGSDVSLYGALRSAGDQPSFVGNMEAASDNLRALLNWLKIDVSKVPAERLRKLTMTAGVQLDPRQLALHDVDASLDSSHLVGGANVLLQARPAFGVSIAVDRLNLDAYLPTLTAVKAAAPAKEAPGKEARPNAGDASAAGAASPLRVLTTFDANLRARVEQLIYRGQEIRGIDLDGTVESGMLTLRKARVDDLAGLKGQLSGSVGAAADRPKLDVAFDASAADLAPFLRFADVKPPAPAAELGAFALKGRLKGWVDQAAFDVDGALLGGTYKAKGTAGFGPQGPVYDIDFAVQEPQLARLVHLFASDAALGELGALDLSAHATGDAGTIALTGIKAQSSLLDAAGDLDVSGFPAKPVVKADLTAASRRPGLLLALAQVGQSAALDRLGAVQATLKADGDADGFTLDSKLAASGGTLALSGKVANADKGPSYDLALSAAHPDLATILRALAPDYHPASAKLGELKLATKIQGGPDKVALSDLAAKLGPVTLSGTIEAALAGPRPKLVARLVASAVDLDPFLPAEGAGGPSEGNGGGKSGAHPRGQGVSGASPRWTTTPLELAALRSNDADVALSTPALTYGQYRIENAKLAATLSDGVLALDGLTGKLYGGDLKLTGKLDAKSAPQATLALRLAGANLGGAGLKVSQIRLTSGVLAASADLAARGASELALVESLSGNGAIKMQDGVIQGFDLSAVNARLAQVNRTVDLLGLIQTGMSGGETKVKRLDGTFTVKDGIATNNDLVIDAEGATGKGQGTVELPRWYMDYGVDFKLTGVADAPPFSIKLKGPPDDPRKFLNANALQEYILARGASAVLKDVGKGNKGLGGILKALPGGQAPAPSTPQSPQAQPAPAPSAQDIIQNLLKGFQKKQQP